MVVVVVVGLGKGTGETVGSVGGVCGLRKGAGGTVGSGGSGFVVSVNTPLCG